MHIYMLVPVSSRLHGLSGYVLVPPTFRGELLSGWGATFGGPYFGEGGTFFGPLLLGNHYFRDSMVL